jgi:hypothetical protein
MNLFSVIYDPTTSSPFGILVEGPDGHKSAHGLNESGRNWAKSGNISAPSWMISTGFSPYTKSAQDAISLAINGDVVISLSDIREHVSPEMIYAGRTIRKNTAAIPVRKFSISQATGKSKIQVAEYLAEKFKSSIKQSTVVYEIKSANVCFSEKINTLKSSNDDPGKTWLVDRVGSFLGRSTLRRMGEKVNFNSKSAYSENNRANRRVKSLIGNIEVDISWYPTSERINFSGFERVKRI